MRHRFSHRPLAAVIALLALTAAPAAAHTWGNFFGTSATGTGAHGYVQIAHSAALNPTGAFTFEAWVWEVAAPSGSSCRSVAGKNWHQAWWIGICTGPGGKRILRSYLKGTSSLRDGGEVFFNQWTHIAVTFDGSKRRHYVDGELVAEFPETGPLTTSTSPLRFFSDVDFEYTPPGFVREIRLWNVARTLAQLRAQINKNITAPQAGLIGVWPLAANANNIVGAYDGTIVGAGAAIYNYNPANTCVAGSQVVCFGGRFAVFATWHRFDTETIGNATVVPGFSSDSANFWFFSAPNWELLVKTVNGCGLNNRHWIFYAPVTDVHYKIFVYDATTDRIRVFLGYKGLTQGATDTDALNVCP